MERNNKSTDEIGKLNDKLKQMEGCLNVYKTKYKLLKKRGNPF